MSVEFADISILLSSAEILLCVPFTVSRTALLETKAFTVVFTFETPAATPTAAPPYVFPLTSIFTLFTSFALTVILLAFIFAPVSTKADVV